MAIVFGNVYADEVTMKFTGTSNTNMTGENDAALVGLDASAWSVIGAQGNQTNMPGLNQSGQIRLYWHAEGGNTITVSSLTGATINSIKFTFAAATATADYSNVSVTVGGNAVSGTDGTFAINSTSFILGNANTSNVQVRFTELVINYTPAGGSGGGESGTSEKWTAVVDGAAAPEFAAATTEGNNLVVTVTKTNATMKAVSSRTPADIADASGAGLNQDTWTQWNDAKWEGPKNQGDIDFWWMQGTGVPYISFVSEQKTREGEPLDEYKANYSYYNPDGSTGLPTSGEYVKFTSKVDGMFKIGFWVNKNAGRKLYLAKESDKKGLIWDADPTKTEFKVEGYINGCNEFTDDTKTAVRKKFFSYINVEDYELGLAEYPSETDKNDDETPKIVNQKSMAKWGWFVFDAKADETYWVFGSNWQFGIQGFEFTPGGKISEYTGIEAIQSKTNNVWNANAPMYNLSGQKVDKSYKGIVIQNGRKFFNK